MEEMTTERIEPMTTKRRTLRQAASAALLHAETRIAAKKRRLADRICDAAALPPLTGTAEETARAEALRESTLAHMALRRRPPAQESMVLERMRAHTDAAWWVDTAYACGGAGGILRLLNRQNERELGIGRFAPRTEAAQATQVRYFIDGENVSPSHACVQEALQTPKAHVVLFVSDHCQWPREENEIRAALPEGVSVECIDCDTGTKNAMDFQLVGMAGEYLAGHPRDEAYIVSNDTGYDAAIRMWKSQGYTVGRIGNDGVSEHMRKTKDTAQMDDEALKRVALSFLKWNGYQEDEKERLAEILVQYARGALPWPYSNDVHAAIGHYMKCGQRYMQIYAAERRGIEKFLAAADAA